MVIITVRRDCAQKKKKAHPNLLNDVCEPDSALVADKPARLEVLLAIGSRSKLCNVPALPPKDQKGDSRQKAGVDFVQCSAPNWNTCDKC